MDKILICVISKNEYGTWDATVFIEGDERPLGTVTYSDYLRAVQWAGNCGAEVRHHQ